MGFWVYFVYIAVDLLIKIFIRPIALFSSAIINAFHFERTAIDRACCGFVEREFAWMM